MAGARFFCGDAAGVPKTVLVEREDVLREVEDLGEGVRCLAAFSEMRADFRGEKGSQLSV